MPSTPQRLMAKLFRRSSSSKEAPASSKQRQPSPASPISCASTCCSETSEGKLLEAQTESEEEETSSASNPRLAGAQKRFGRKQTLAERPLAELPGDELRAMVRNGTAIPPKQRALLWPRWFATGESEPLPNSLDVSFVSGPSEVRELEAQVPADVARLIELDVPRTMPGRLGSRERETLGRALRCLAALQPEVGYCQGLNNVTAVFVLLGFDAAMSATGAHCILSRCCPGYHLEGLPGFRRDAAILQRLTEQLPEELQRRLEALGVPLEALASQHFLALSAGHWPLEATLQLWDLLLLEGRPALMASFLAMLQLYLPGACSEEAEPVEVFRLSVQRGMAQDPSKLVKLTGELIALTASACS